MCVIFLLDSDKENSQCHDDISTNTSDLKKYQLIVEKETQNSKCFDQSINNILNHLSIFKNRSVSKESPICNNIKENSPLCSTPFSEKYRGKSIYNFSPIAFNFEDNKEPEIVEENDATNLIVENIVQNDDSCNIRKSIILNNVRKSILPDNHEAVNMMSCKNEKMKCNECTSKVGMGLEFDNTSQSFVNNTEKPFIGFTNKTECNIIQFNNSNNTNRVDRSSKKDTSSKSFLNISDKNVSNDFDNQNKVIEKPCNILPNASLDELPSEPFLGFSAGGTEIHCDVESIKSDVENSVLDDVDNDSLYDTCESNKYVEILEERRPLVFIDRLNDSIMQKYLAKTNNSLLQGNKSISSRCCVSLDSDDYNNSGILCSSTDQSKSYSPKDTNISSCVSGNIENAGIFENSLGIDKDEICSVFVTKRRRNEVTNDSFILADDSFSTLFVKNNVNISLENVENSIINKQKSDRHCELYLNQDVDISNTSRKSLEDFTFIDYKDKQQVENKEISFIENDKFEPYVVEDNLKEAND